MVSLSAGLLVQINYYSFSRSKIVVTCHLNKHTINFTYCEILSLLDHSLQVVKPSTLKGLIQ